MTTRKQELIRQVIDLLTIDIESMTKHKKQLQGQLEEEIRSELMGRYGLVFMEPLMMSDSFYAHLIDKGNEYWDSEDIYVAESATRMCLINLFEDAGGVFGEIDYDVCCGAGRVPVQIILDMKAAYAAEQERPKQIPLL